MDTNEKCPHCGAIRVEGREYACGFIFREGVRNNPRPHECLLNSEVSAHAATKRELSNATDTLDLMRDEFQRIVARMVEDGMIIKDVGQEILGICNRARSDISQRVPVIAQRDAAEARVRELERWKSAAKAFWRAVMSEDDPDLMPAAMLQVSELIELEKQTLGEAMPRKEEK